MTASGHQVLSVTLLLWYNQLLVLRRINEIVKEVTKFLKKEKKRKL